MNEDFGFINEALESSLLQTSDKIKDLVADIRGDFQVIKEWVKVVKEMERIKEKHNTHESIKRDSFRNAPRYAFGDIMGKLKGYGQFQHVDTDG